ncbi:hypothetical protein [Massilia pseudoviolaceinigra]|uniref:hypothetical protein n=1 Tax=Massilia pseudoviolaceinigra TaxID=3057165 RepID=UPI002796CB77|nr:hypothetical protein [Massilia sp. CCM 9206]MDQ1920920.1 hypothetical protein [Massilia sp. CCM 9206]
MAAQFFDWFRPMQSDISGMSPGAPTARYRALFYVFDGGSGIGHLRRLARIAAAMQDRFSCLIITGHDVGPQWIVAQGCEYIRLPAWDSLIPAKAAYWGRTPFLDVPLSEAVELRRSILEGVFKGFRPDVLLVDHLPLGAHEELAPIIRNGDCRKYLITRGVQNETEDLQRLVLGGAALDSLRDNYTRILSAIDKRIFDFSASYGLPAEIAQKISSTGYVAPPVAPEHRAQTRAARGIGEDALWVVASAGGGQWGEPLMEACLALTDLDRTVHFDIILGPRSRLPRPANNPELLDGGRIRVHTSCSSLADFHSAADLVITTGGYNSLLETLQGQARILCLPYRKDPGDEPVRHANCLKQHVDLQVDTDISRLPAMFEAAIRECRTGPARDQRRAISMDGADGIAQIVFNDVSSAKGL